MKEPKLKTVYVCSNCGENTMNEDVVAETPKAGLSGGKSAAPARQEGVTSLTAKRLADISTTEEKSRILTGISELDRVLGGGIVLGGVVLLSGEPGVGKSALAEALAQRIYDAVAALRCHLQPAHRAVYYRRGIRAPSQTAGSPPESTPGKYLSRRRKRRG